MFEDDAPGDSIVIDLRSPETVARRCIILATIMRRFTIESTRQDDPFGSAFDLREWLRSEELWKDATQSEMEYLLQPPDNPALDSSLNAPLVAEGLATVAWALRLRQSLSGDHLAQLATLIQVIPGPWDATAPWIAAQTMRPETEIARTRELHEIWNWRLETELDRRSASERELIEIENLIEEVTSEAVAADLLLPGDDGGFTLEGFAVTALAPGKIAEQQLLTQERLIALNWICGYGDDWNNVPIDV